MDKWINMSTARLSWNLEKVLTFLFDRFILSMFSFLTIEISNGFASKISLMAIVFVDRNLFFNKLNRKTGKF